MFKERRECWNERLRNSFDILPRINLWILVHRRMPAEAGFTPSPQGLMPNPENVYGH